MIYLTYIYFLGIGVCHLVLCCLFICLFVFVLVLNDCNPITGRFVISNDQWLKDPTLL